jgi:invasion protein IalB
MNRRYKIICNCILAGVALAALPVGAQDASALPGGATSLQETYDDWLVQCATQQTGKACAMQQEQRAQETGQRVLAIELRPAGTGVEGVVILPFGLALAKGATVQVDEGKVSAPLAFSTCLPAGCVAPLTFNAEMLQGLRKGSALKINVTPDGGGEPIALSVSLKGFSAAFDRTAVLVK